MAVRGYINRGAYFCIDHHQPGSDDEPLEEVPEGASCIRCQRLLSEVADEQGRV